MKKNKKRKKYKANFSAYTQKEHKDNIPEKPNEKIISNIKDIVDLLKTHKEWLLLIITLIVAANFNVLGGEFVMADDIPGIVNNPLIKDLGATINTLKLDQIYLSLMVNTFGYSPLAFHIVSLVFHITNVILGFVLIYMLFKNSKLAIITAFLFSVHPINSEAVMWISARAYLFYTFFGLLTMIFYFLYKESNVKKYLYASLAIFGMGVFFLDTPWILTIPMILVVIDQVILENNININLKKIINYAPYAILCILYGIIILLPKFQSRSEELALKHYLDPERPTPLINRIPYTISKSAELLIFPKNLTIYHEGELITKTSYTLMVFATIAIFFTIVYTWNKNRKVSALMLIILLSLSPTFYPQVIAWFVADRYLYIGSLFYCVLLAMLLLHINRKIKMDKFLGISVLTILLLFTARTVIRTYDFKTNKQLWLSTQKVAVYSPRVYNNLGDVYSKEQKYDLAIENFKKAVQLKPNYAEAVHNIGFTYMLMSDFDNARKYLLKSWEMNPIIFQSPFKLGVVELETGNPEKAKEYFQAALDINPNFPEAQRGMLVAEQYIQQNQDTSEEIE